MAVRLPPLSSLRVFVTAARRCSFLEAANELHITPAAVSRSIRSLEEHLDLPLFRRGNRQVFLTDEGEQYLRDLGDVFERIALATQNLLAERAKRPLVVCAFPSFMIDWLIPKWSHHHQADPKMDLKFVTTQSPVIDFEKSGIHAAILTDHPDYPGCTSERIFTGGLVPISAPKYLPPGTSMNDVAEWRNCIVKADTRPNDWKRWAAANGFDEAEFADCYGYESSKLLYQAVAANTGIGIGIREVLSSEFASRTLINPFPESKAAECSFYLIWPIETENHPLFPIFREWVHQEAAGTNGDARSAKIGRRDGRRPER